MTTATPARGAAERKLSRPLNNYELRGIDMDRQQFEAATYAEPDPTPAWIRPLYLCACGFESRPSSEAFTFTRVPHACRLAE